MKKVVKKYMLPAVSPALRIHHMRHYGLVHKACKTRPYLTKPVLAPGEKLIAAVLLPGHFCCSTVPKQVRVGFVCCLNLGSWLSSLLPNLMVSKQRAEPQAPVQTTC